MIIKRHRTLLVVGDESKDIFSISPGHKKAP